MKRIDTLMKPLQVTINVGRQAQSYVYELDSRSRQELLERFPKLQPVPVVVVSNRPGKAPEKLQQSVWPQVAQMLLGLTELVPRRLVLPSIDVRVVSPREDEELGTFELPPPHGHEGKLVVHG